LRISLNTLYVGEPERKTALGRRRRRWKGNVKIYGANVYTELNWIKRVVHSCIHGNEFTGSING
jgi:hypothetical protein